jgi:allophanate hydrolase
MTSGGLVEVRAGGLGCTVQDAGRVGHRHEGVALAGCLDLPLAEAANVLAGNAAGTACLEWRGPGLTLQVVCGPVRVALAGRATARVVPGEGPARSLGAWRGATLVEGDRLVLGAVAAGCAYLALGGGVQVPAVLGSRSTHGRTRMGGLEGRMLRPGDRLPCGRLSAGSGRALQAPRPFAPPDGPIRVVWGPQQDHFTAAARAQFIATPWRVTPEQDRMGLRLAGPALAHVDAAAADIASDGVAPGAVQVPASGQPIVLLADGQTVGGYPKIACVIRADLPRLAQAPVGSTLRFEPVEAAAARAALRTEQRRWQDWAATLVPCGPEGLPDPAALCGLNLISGMVRAEP